ncbi:MAG: hypothetical protein E7505_01710 [Ruminococcus sp.]|jgi:hypothetical protein|nr:hypothetical protein [Ruminococcus sp.]
MTRKNIKSVFLISLAGVGVWLAGFIIITLLRFENAPAVNRAWLIITFLGTLVVSVARNMKNDER